MEIDERNENVGIFNLLLFSVLGSDIAMDKWLQFSTDFCYFSYTNNAYDLQNCCFYGDIHILQGHTEVGDEEFEKAKDEASLSLIP